MQKKKAKKKKIHYLIEKHKGYVRKEYAHFIFIIFHLIVL